MAKRPLDAFFGLKASKVPNTAGCEEKCKVPNTTSLDNSVSHSEDLGSSSSSPSLAPSANSIGTRSLDISQHQDDQLARPQCQFKATSFGKKGNSGVSRNCGILPLSG